MNARSVLHLIPDLTSHKAFRHVLGGDQTCIRLLLVVVSRYCNRNGGVAITGVVKLCAFLHACAHACTQTHISTQNCFTLRKILTTPVPICTCVNQRLFKLWWHVTSPLIRTNGSTLAVTPTCSTDRRSRLDE